MQKTVECFYPGGNFPAISVTGNECALDCKHCSKKYLQGMVRATTPTDLVSVAEALAERGASGFLLSGGVDGSGRVPLCGFVDAIAEIKATTDLRINAHIGLSDEREIKRLVKSGIDSFSVDVYGSVETISEVLGLKATPEDYFSVVENLRNAGAPIVAPHVCVGVHAGRMHGELKAIERLSAAPPEVLVLISLIPTKGTAYESVSPPSREEMLEVIGKARHDLPTTKLLLGCMRSKLDRSSEYDYLEAGLDGIVLPVARTVERLRAEGVSVKKRAICCSFAQSYL